MIEDLKAGATKRAALQQEIKSLTLKPRSVPNFDPSNPTPAKLAQFPSKDIIDKASQAVKKVHRDSEQVYDKAVDINRHGHDLVVKDSLPIPVSQPLAIRYRTLLQEALDKLRLQDLASGIPPTDEEKKNRADLIWKELEKKLIIVNDKATNGEQIKAQYDEAVMATSYKMYVDPLAVMKVPVAIPSDGRSADPVSIWWAQVYFWVTSDVVAAIKELNDKSPNVLESPVKNLLVLNVPETFFPPVAPLQPAAEGAPTVTTGGLPEPTVAVPEAPDKSPTERISK